MRLIDADALLEEINGIDYTSNWRAAMVVSIISLPTIDPVRHGRWQGGEIGHCSACGHRGCASDIWDGVEGDGYCPNCGALMDGGTEDDK